MEESVNVFDELLLPCGDNPVTGFYRDGCCNTGNEDAGSHTVCVRVTKEFLEFSNLGDSFFILVASFITYMIHHHLHF